jgi:UDP-glucose 4-epimerase
LKLLITGANGFVGRYLVDALHAHHEIYALVRASPAVQFPEGVHQLTQDLLNLNEGTLPNRIDGIIHLAQSRLYKQFPQKADDIYEINVHSTFRLLDYARRSHVGHVVFASSGGIYGYGDAPFNESSPAVPSNFYLSSKYISELLVNSYAPYFNTAVLRLFFAYGANQHQGMFMPRMVHNVLEGLPIILQGPQGIRMNPVHIQDIIRAVAKALELDGNHVINVAGPQVLSLYEIGRIIADRLGKKPNFAIQPDQHVNHLVADIGKMKAMLVSPQTYFPEGIVEVCDEILHLQTTRN